MYSEYHTLHAELYYITITYNVFLNANVEYKNIRSRVFGKGMSKILINNLSEDADIVDMPQRCAFIEGLDDAIELGRSFVRAEYQKSHAPLMLLWQGIARYVNLHPKYCRLFGAVSISSDYHPVSQQFMVEFLRENRFAAELARQVRPRTGLQRRPATFWQRRELAELSDIGAMSDVVGQLESGQRGVPVLLRQYLKLGGLLLGFNVDRAFGNSLDGLILVDLRQTDKTLLQRYMGREECRGFLRYHASRKLGLALPLDQANAVEISHAPQAASAMPTARSNPGPSGNRRSAST